MSNEKISAMTPLDTINPTTIFPVVDAGANYSVTYAQMSSSDDEVEADYGVAGIINTASEQFLGSGGKRATAYSSYDNLLLTTEDYINFGSSTAWSLYSTWNFVGDRFFVGDTLAFSSGNNISSTFYLKSIADIFQITSDDGGTLKLSNGQLDLSTGYKVAGNIGATGTGASGDTFQGGLYIAPGGPLSPGFTGNGAFTNFVIIDGRIMSAS